MSNALVPLTPTIREHSPTRLHGRADAGFVAHLIATSARLPQTRERRRAEPEEAAAAYRTLGQWPSAAGRTLSRAL